MLVNNLPEAGKELTGAEGTIQGLTQRQEQFVFHSEKKKSHTSQHIR